MTSPIDPSAGEIDQGQLEELLLDFDVHWNADRFEQVVDELADGHESFRQVALLELSKVDIEKRMESGGSPRCEDYLKHFGTPDTLTSVIVELATTEYFLRLDNGQALDLEGLESRFPEQHDAIRRRLESHLQQPNVDTDAPQGTHETLATKSQRRPHELPDRFGRYEIRRQLGSGAMGAVYLAWDTTLGREVALKIPIIAEEDSEELIERFRREARAAATLRHANVCPVFDVGSIDGTHFISMAFIEGSTLEERLRSETALSSAESANLIASIARGVLAAHQQGIIHRDLKPANIMIDAQGEPVVTDFGLARPASSEHDSTVTKSGALVGTPAYMSPEQVRGERATTRSDIYSLGVLLYRMLAGRLPFDGSVASVFAQVLRDAPERPSHHRNDIDPRIEEVCMRMIAKDPADRFGNLEEVINQLDAKSPSEPKTEVAPAGPPEHEHGWRSAVVAIGTIGLLALLSTVVFFTTQYGDVRVKVIGNDPGIEIKFDGKELKVGETSHHRSGKRPLAIRLGDQRLKIGENIPISIAEFDGEATLVVKSNGVAIAANELEVERRKTTLLTIEFVPRKPPAESGHANSNGMSSRENLATPSHPDEGELLALYHRPEPPLLSDWLRGRNVITVAQDGSGDYETIREAVDQLKRGDAIEILDQGPYFETLVIEKPPKDTGIFSRHDPIVWSSFEDSKKIHHIAHPNDFRINGLVFVRDGGEGLTGKTFRSIWTNRVVIENCVFHSLQRPIEGDERPCDVSLPTDPPIRSVVVLRDNLLNTSCKNFLSPSSCDLLIARNYFYGRGGSKVNLNPGGWGERHGLGRHNLAVIHNVFDGSAPFFFDMRWRDPDNQRILIANNTSLRTISDSIFYGPQVGERQATRQVALINNVMRDIDFVDAPDAASAEKEWLVSSNASSQQSRLNEERGGKSASEIEYLSGDWQSDQFARIDPKCEAARAGFGGELPDYIGALPPGEPPSAGDWFTRLIKKRERIEERLGEIQAMRVAAENAKTSRGQQVSRELGTWKLGLERDDLLPGLALRPAKIARIRRWQVVPDIPASFFRPILNHDDRLVAIHGLSGLTHIFDVSGKEWELVSIVPNAHVVSTRVPLDWHPSEDRFAGVSESGNVACWSHEGSREWVSEAGVSTALAWSPNGKFLASLNEQGTTLLVLDGLTGDVIDKTRVDSPAFDIRWKDDELVLILCESAKLVTWNRTKRDIHSTWDFRHLGPFLLTKQYGQISHRGRWIVWCDRTERDRITCIVDVMNQKLHCQLDEAGWGYASSNFSADGSRFAISKFGGLCLIFDVATGNVIWKHNFERETLFVNICMSQSGEKIVTAPFSSSVSAAQLRRIDDPTTISQIRGVGGERSLSWFPFENTIAFNGADRVIRTLNLNRNEIADLVREPKSVPTLIEVSADGNLAAIGTLDPGSGESTGRILNLKTSEVANELHEVQFPNQYRLLRFSDDGRFLATLSGSHIDSEVQTYDASSGHRLWFSELSNGVHNNGARAAFSWVANRIIFSTGPGSVEGRSVDASLVPMRLQVPQRGDGVKGISIVGETLVGLTVNQLAIHKWDVEGRLVQSFQLPTWARAQLALHPNEKHVAVMYRAEDGIRGHDRVALWDVRDGFRQTSMQVRRSPRGGGDVEMRWSPEGDFLAIQPDFWGEECIRIVAYPSMLPYASLHTFPDSSFAMLSASGELIIDQGNAIDHLRCIVEGSDGRMELLSYRDFLETYASEIEAVVQP